MGQTTVSQGFLREFNVLFLAAMPNYRVKRDARTADFTSWLRPRTGAPYPER